MWHLWHKQLLQRTVYGLSPVTWYAAVCNPHRELLALCSAYRVATTEMTCAAAIVAWRLCSLTLCLVFLQEDSRVILAQKYADGGDLLKALHHAGGRLTEHSAVSMVVHPLLSCMVYLHGKGIIHR